VTSKECKNEATASILRVRVDGETSYDNEATLEIIRGHCSKHEYDWRPF